MLCSIKHNIKTYRTITVDIGNYEFMELRQGRVENVLCQLEAKGVAVKNKGLADAYSVSNKYAHQ